MCQARWFFVSAETQDTPQRHSTRVPPFRSDGVYCYALAAFRDGDEWLNSLVVYLQDNRDFAAEFVREKLPNVRMTPLEGTCLAWLDCRHAGIAGNLQRFLLEAGRLATVDGALFGPGGEGFVRLNLACPRETLNEGMERLRSALQSL